MWILIGAALVLLGICSVSDIKRREVRLGVILVFVIFAVLYRGYEGLYWEDFFELILRFLPGLLMMIVAAGKKKAVGMGDALILLATGYILGAECNFLMILAGSLIGGIYSLVLVCLKKKGIKDTLPFVPFLLLGCICLSVFVVIKGYG